MKKGSQHDFSGSEICDRSRDQSRLNAVDGMDA